MKISKVDSLSDVRESPVRISSKYRSVIDVWKNLFKKSLYSYCKTVSIYDEILRVKLRNSAFSVQDLRGTLLQENKTLNFIRINVDFEDADVENGKGRVKTVSESDRPFPLFDIFPKLESVGINVPSTYGDFILLAYLSDLRDFRKYIRNFTGLEAYLNRMFSIREKGMDIQYHLFIKK